jgi:hypothetical protein
MQTLAVGAEHLRVGVVIDADDLGITVEGVADILAKKGIPREPQGVPKKTGCGFRADQKSVRAS